MWLDNCEEKQQCWQRCLIRELIQKIHLLLLASLEQAVQHEEGFRLTGL